MGSCNDVLPFSSAKTYAPGPRARIDDDISLLLSGNSTAAAQLRAQMRRVAPYFRTLSLTGEAGCGAEAAARALHQMCPLHEREFVRLDPEEAEARFSDGAAQRPEEGLLFLPEAEKLSTAAQEGLLKMLRQQSAHSTRVVAFVGRGLKPYISAGLYSPELAGMLGSLRVGLPALRERAADIPTLINERLQRHRRRSVETGQRMRPLYLSDEFVNAATRANWPGNLRQMHDVLDWLLEHCSGRTIGAKDLTEAIEELADKKSVKDMAARMVPLEQVAQEHIRAVLMACHGNKLRAAEVLGISRSTLYRMLDATEGPELLLAG